MILFAAMVVGGAIAALGVALLLLAALSLVGVEDDWPD